MRSPRFTQRDFFSDKETGLPTSAITAAETLREESWYKRWTGALPEGYEATIDDLKKAHVVVVRRKDTRDISERWFAVRNLESTKVGESSCPTGVRISDVVEVGQGSWVRTYSKSSLQ